MVVQSKAVVRNYFNSYDVFQKYFLGNIYKCPAIKKIVLSFLLKDLLISSIFIKKNNNIQIKAFYIFYVLFSLVPFLRLSHVVSNRNLQKTTENPYSLKIVLSSTEDINNFLLMFFLENHNSLVQEQLTIFKSYNQTFNNNIVYEFLIPSKFFFDLNTFFSQNIKEANLKELTIKCSLVFDRVFNTENSVCLVRNLSFLWLAPYRKLNHKN